LCVLIWWFQVRLASTFWIRSTVQSWHFCLTIFDTSKVLPVLLKPTQAMPINNKIQKAYFTKGLDYKVQTHSKAIMKKLSWNIWSPSFFLFCWLLVVFLFCVTLTFCLWVVSSSSGISTTVCFRRVSS
jgi:hypothetical protein